MLPRPPPPPRFVHSHPSIKLKVLKRLSVQILEGLEYLHTHTPPIIHRDVKCENILYDWSSGDVRIGDLGLAMQLVDRATSDGACPPARVSGNWWGRWGIP